MCWIFIGGSILVPKDRHILIRLDEILLKRQHQNNIWKSIEKDECKDIENDIESDEKPSEAHMLEEEIFTSEVHVLEEEIYMYIIDLEIEKEYIICD